MGLKATLPNHIPACRFNFLLDCNGQNQSLRLFSVQLDIIPEKSRFSYRPMICKVLYLFLKTE